MNALLIAGTDTDTGKTVLTSALMAYWRTFQPDRSLGLMKLMQTGTGDRELYAELFGLSPDITTPLHFQAPLAPPIAAQQEGRQVDLERVWTHFEQMHQRYDWVLVEALGGLGSPVDGQTTVADLAWDWHLPTVLVVPVRLGAIAQAVANVALARQAKVNLRGIVLNCLSPEAEAAIAHLAPPKLIRSLTQMPVLGTLPYLENPKDLEKLAHAAAHLQLESLIPV